MTQQSPLPKTRLPAESRGLRIEAVTHSEQSLVAAISKAADLWDSSSSVEPLSIGVDTRKNSLVVNVLVSDGVAAEAPAAKLAEELGVPLAIDATATSRGGVVACTDRDDCSDPYKAGIRIHGGTSTGVPCTLAYPIKIGSAIQVLSAGHCAYYASAWFHQGEGKVGDVLDHQWVEEGIDILRMEMPDVQASERI